MSDLIKLSDNKPLSRLDAAKLQAKLIEELEVNEAKIIELKEDLDESESWVSIIRAAKENGVHESAFKCRELKAYSKANDYMIKVAPCPRYVTKNLYHKEVFQAVYPELIK